MQRIFSIVILLFGLQELYAQPDWLWTDQMPTYGGVYSLSRTATLAEDRSGNVIAGGWFRDSVDLDPGAGQFILHTDTSGMQQEAFVQKLDQYGNFLWGMGIDESYSINSIATDDSNNIYIAGIFSDSCDFDQGPGTALLIGQGDIFILKLNSAGGFVWVKQIGDWPNENFFEMILDRDENLIVSGSFCDSLDLDPGPGIYNVYGNHICVNAFLVKLDSDGQFIWGGALVPAGVGSLFTSDIACDYSGNILVCGVFMGTADFDPSTALSNMSSSSSTFNDGFILKVDSNGTMIWVKSMGGSDHDSYSRIATDAQDNIILVGGFGASADVDPGIGTNILTSNGGRDEFLCKLDSAGNLIWVNQYSGISYQVVAGCEIVVDSASRIFMATGFEQGVDWDPGPANVSYGFGYDLVLSCYNSAGQLAWARPITGTAYVAIHGLCVSSYGITIGGSFQSTMNFAIAPNSQFHTATVFEDAYVSKYKDLVLSTPETEVSSSTSIFPNPATSLVTIFSSDEIETVEIFDVSGNLVLCENVSSLSKSYTIALNLTSGIYHLRCTTVSGNSSIDKLVIITQ